MSMTYIHIDTKRAITPLLESLIIDHDIQKFSDLTQSDLQEITTCILQSLSWSDQFNFITENKDSDALFYNFIKYLKTSKGNFSELLKEKAISYYLPIIKEIFEELKNDLHNTYFHDAFNDDPYYKEEMEEVA